MARKTKKQTCSKARCQAASWGLMGRAVWITLGAV